MKWTKIYQKCCDRVTIWSLIINCTTFSFLAHVCFSNSWKLRHSPSVSRVITRLKTHAFSNYDYYVVDRHDTQGIYTLMYILIRLYLSYRGKSLNLNSFFFLISNLIICAKKCQNRQWKKKIGESLKVRFLQ